MEKLKELQALVKCSIRLEYNEHKTYYESVREYWFDRADPGLAPDVVGSFDIDTEPDVWVIQVHDKSPFGFFQGMSNDLDALLQWAIDVCKEHDA